MHDPTRPELRYGPVAQAFRRVSGPPFDFGERDYLAFADDGSPRHRLLIDQWGGPLCVQVGVLMIALTAVSPGLRGHALVGYLVAGGALATGLVLSVWGDAIPLRVMDCAAVGGTGLLVVLGLEGGDLVHAVPAVSVVVGTAFFAQRSVRMSLFITACLGVGYGVVLAGRDLGPAPLSRWVMVMAAVVSSGIYVRWIRREVIVAVTAEHEARERAEEAGAELARVSSDKSGFVARMSHELRTPLNAVLGFTTLLLERMAGPLTDLQAEYLADVKDAAGHLVDLVDGVLDLAVVEAGRSELVWAPFVMADAITDSCRLVRERAARQGVTLVARVAEDVPVIEADGRKVRQVLLNLLANAVRFTPAGGRVEVTSWTDGPSVLVAVRDTGIGIARQDQARMFDRFEQAAATEGGTGLGLSLARRFLDQHGGTITVDSEVGQGTTFTFSLPSKRTVAVSDSERHLAVQRAVRARDDDRGGDLYDALVVPGSPANRRLVTMVGRWMGMSAAGLCLLLAVITPGDVGLRVSVALLAACAVTVTAILGRFVAAAPVIGVELLSVVGAAAISAITYASGTFAELTALGYGWIIITAFAPWARNTGVALVGFVGAAYALVLALDAGPGSEVQRWVAIVGVLIVNGLTVRSLVGKLRLMVFFERTARRIAEDVETELVAATAHKDDFVASMSHELRTPLNAIIGFSELVLGPEAGPLTEQQREYLTDVASSGRKLLALINDILDLAKVEATGQLATEPTDLEVIVGRAMMAQEAAAGERSVRLCSAPSPSRVEALVDPPLFQQALSNVIENAVRFSPVGAEVAISIDRVGDAAITTIDDQGPGITVGQHDKIFDAFYTTDEGVGHGLGLAIAHRIVELHGGTISARGRAGGGSTFAISVPASPVPRGDDAAPPVVSQPGR